MEENASVFLASMLIREAVENAREQGVRPEDALLEKTGIPAELLQVAQSTPEHDIREMPTQLAETLLALRRFLEEDTPLATKDWLVDPQLHPRMQDWYTSLETFTRRRGIHPERRGDRGFGEEAAYDGGEVDAEEATESRFWVLPASIALWPGGTDLIDCRQMQSEAWRLLRDQTACLMPRPSQEPKGTPTWPTALAIDWRALRSDCSWWMRLQRPTLKKEVYVGGARQWEYRCTRPMHEPRTVRLPVNLRVTCKICKQVMQKIDLDRVAGIRRRNQENILRRLEDDIGYLRWLRSKSTLSFEEMVRMAPKAVESLARKGLVSDRTVTYYSRMLRILGNTAALETEVPPKDRERWRHGKKKGKPLTAHDRAERILRKQAAKKAQKNLGVAFLPPEAAGDQHRALHAEVIRNAKRFGIQPQRFHPDHRPEHLRLSWGIKVYFDAEVVEATKSL